MYRLPGESNPNTAVMHYKGAADQNADDTELIVLVRTTRREIEEHGELDSLLRDFATKLLKRRLIAKVEFLPATVFSRARAVDASNNPIHSSATNWKLLASVRDGIFVMNDKITKFTGQLFVELKPVKALLLQAYETLTRLARTVADKPRRLREELCAREKNLRELLTTSFDAILVVDGDRRFVTANSRALDLFGISKRNITMFAIDAFLPHRQIGEFDENRASLTNQNERHGECEIKRLDGSLLVAEYMFVANVVPRRNLYRFREITPRMSRLGVRTKMPVSHRQSQRHWAINPISAASES